MYSLNKAILVTNNSKVFDKYNSVCTVIVMPNYESVLIKVRDMVYNKHQLLTHPQASSLKPNQTLYRSIAVYPCEYNDNVNDMLLIEKCIEVYHQWQKIAPSPKSYTPNVDNDFKTIDLSVVDGFMGRIG